eukprot:bmy_05503T0
MIWMSFQFKICTNWSPMSTEANQAPFNLTEGESELILGFNVEYDSRLIHYIFLSRICQHHHNKYFPNNPLSRSPAQPPHIRTIHNQLHYQNTTINNFLVMNLSILSLILI